LNGGIGVGKLGEKLGILVLELLDDIHRNVGGSTTQSSTQESRPGTHRILIIIRYY
jgi:hypothetical protein